MDQLTSAQDVVAESARRARACVAPRDRRGERSSGRKRPARAELEARLARWEAAFARGRARGAESAKLAALLRRSAVERAVHDLLQSEEVGRRWRVDAIVSFIAERQAQIGLKRAYARATLDRIVRRVLRESGRLVKDSV